MSHPIFDMLVGSCIYAGIGVYITSFLKHKPSKEANNYAIAKCVCNGFIDATVSSCLSVSRIVCSPLFIIRDILNENVKLSWSGIETLTDSNKKLFFRWSSFVPVMILVSLSYGCIIKPILFGCFGSIDTQLFSFSGQIANKVVDGVDKCATLLTFPFLILMFDIAPLVTLYRMEIFTFI